jgi:N-acetylmuramoyl-L-alanine amidase
MPISIPSDIAVDLRQPIVGDSFGWAAIEPGAAKKSIVIHATASDGPNEDGFTMADYHVNHNGWGGIGVHFCVTKDEYPGRPNFAGPGAQVQYVGDLLTWRAGTINQNPGRIHIEISGLFTAGNGIPSANQLRKTRALIDHLLTQTPELPSLNYYSQVTYHNAVPGQNTSCPGWDHPSFQAWFAYLKGGPFPEGLYAPSVPPSPPAIPQPPITITPPPPDPAGGVVTPEYEATYHDHPETRAIARSGAHGVDVTTGAVVVPSIAVGTVIDVAGYFNYGGVTYSRTVYSKTHDKWNGLDVTYFDAPTGQPSGDVHVTFVKTPPADPTSVQSNITDEELQAATVPEASKRFSIFQLIAEGLAYLTALIIKKKGH